MSEHSRAIANWIADSRALEGISPKNIRPSFADSYTKAMQSAIAQTYVEFAKAAYRPSQQISVTLNLDKQLSEAQYLLKMCKFEPARNVLTLLIDEGHAPQLLACMNLNAANAYRFGRTHTSEWYGYASQPDIAIVPIADDGSDAEEAHFPSADLLEMIQASQMLREFHPTAEWVRNQTIALLSTMGESLQLAEVVGRWSATAQDKFVDDVAREFVRHFGISPYEAERFLTLLFRDLKSFLAGHPREMAWGIVKAANGDIHFDVRPLRAPRADRAQASVVRT